MLHFLVKTIGYLQFLALVVDLEEASFDASTREADLAFFSFFFLPNIVFHLLFSRHRLVNNSLRGKK